MSIITDALKKAQARRFRNKKTSEPVDEGDLEKNPEQFLNKMIEAEKLKKTGVISNKRLVSIIGALFVILVLGGTVLFFMTSQQSVPRKAVAPEKPARVQAIKKEARSDPKSIFPGKIEQAEEESPAYEPLGTEEQFPTTDKPRQFPTLSGIMYSPTNPQAIMNGEVLSEGEMVRGFKIQKILPNKVKLIYEDKEYELRLR
jgi:hypothetical protein